MEKYLHISVEDLAQDDFFVRWVIDERNDKQWTKWVKENPSMSQKILDARVLVESLAGSKSALRPKQKAKLWSRVDASTRAKTSTENRRSGVFRLWKPISVAASILLLAGLVLFWPKDGETVRVAFADQQSILLPDESRVILYEDAEIQYDPSSWGKKRTIQLKGQAFFEVEKGRPFEVMSEHGRVEVLGTQFEVLDADRSFKVSCVSGKVRVDHEDASQSAVLTKGQVVQIDKNASSWIRTERQPSSIALWRNRSKEYQGTRLEDVIHDVENDYNINIEVPVSYASRSFVGQYVRNDVDSALHAICWPFNLTYKKQSGKYILIEEK